MDAPETSQSIELKLNVDLTKLIIGGQTSIIYKNEHETRLLPYPLKSIGYEISASEGFFLSCTFSEDFDISKEQLVKVLNYYNFVTVEDEDEDESFSVSLSDHSRASESKKDDISIIKLGKPDDLLIDFTREKNSSVILVFKLDDLRANNPNIQTVLHNFKKVVDIVLKSLLEKYRINVVINIPYTDRPTTPSLN